MAKEILLGQRVREKLTGFEGIAVMSSLNLVGIERISVLSGIGKDGKMGEEFGFDINQLEVTDEKQVLKPKTPPKPRFQFRELVRDPITGYEGRVTVRSIHINGCVKIGVQGPVNKHGKVPETEYFEEPILESIEPRVLTKKEIKEEKQLRKTGGPGRGPELRSF